MKPSGNIAKLSIDFKAALADAQRAGIAGDERHRSAAADALLRAQNIIAMTVAELRAHGLQEPVGRLDTVAVMRAKLAAVAIVGGS
jgi:hypothetical protein